MKITTADDLGPRGSGSGEPRAPSASASAPATICIGSSRVGRSCRRRDDPVRPRPARPLRCATSPATPRPTRSSAPRPRRHRPPLSRYRSEVEGRATASTLLREAARWSATPGSSRQSRRRRDPRAPEDQRRCDEMRARLAGALGIDRRARQRQGKDQRGRRRRRPRRGDRRPCRRAPELSVAGTSERSTSRVRDESPLRPQPDRAASRRQRAHGAVQLAARARPRRHLHPPHRGHRRRALDHGVRAEHPRGSALARARLGRRARRRRRGGPVPPVRAAASLRLVRQRAARRRPRVLLLLLAAEARSGTPQRCSRPGVRRSTPAPAATFRPRTARGGSTRASAPAVRFRVPERHRRHVPGSRPRRRHLQHRRHRRSGPRALRRPSGLQLRGGRRRCADGDHACDPRRGPHLEHAAAGAALSRARLRAAAVRAPVAGARARTTRRCRSAMARRRWRSSASAATCPRRSSTTSR